MKRIIFFIIIMMLLTGCSPVTIDKNAMDHKVKCKGSGIIFIEKEVYLHIISDMKNLSFEEAEERVSSKLEIEALHRWDCIHYGVAYCTKSIKEDLWIEVHIPVILGSKENKKRFLHFDRECIKLNKISGEQYEMDAFYIAENLPLMDNLVIRTKPLHKNIRWIDIEIISLMKEFNFDNHL